VSWLIAMLFCRFHGMGAADYRSLRFDSYARMQHFVRRTTYVPFRRILEDLRREFTQRRLHAAFCHSTLGSYLRDALQEGNDDVVACLLFLGLRHVGFCHVFFFLLGGLRCLFL
jgi:hypothetical protein